MMLVEQPTLFDLDEPERPRIPSRALYRDEHVHILDYEGDGRFLLVRGDSVTTIHRDHLVFLREKKHEHPV